MDWLQHAWTYPVALAVISVAVLVAERVKPWRPEQRLLRPRLGWDLLSLVLHGHFTGLWLAMFSSAWILPWVEPRLVEAGLPVGVASGWPLAVQAVVALLVVDFLQWWVHRALHAVPLFWEFHKVHHSIEPGEMDWLGSFRFHWMEPVLYKSALYVPLLVLGFNGAALMVHAILGTLVGHLNHANLDMGHGRWRYVFNSARMHAWHHAYEREGVNFGIIFSAWDWLFRTAYLPAEPPARIGFPGMEELPRTLPGQWAWPLWRRRRALT